MGANEYQVMIVEDEVLLRENISRKIREFSPAFHVVATAADGAEALALLKTCKPDIIITDIVMPVMNGLDFIKNAVEANVNAQFVVLSGYDDFEYAKIAMQYGVRDYILKPFSAAVLQKLLLKLSRDIDQSIDTATQTHIHSLINSPLTQDIMELYHDTHFHVVILFTGNYVYHSFNNACEEFFDSFWQTIDIDSASTEIDEAFSNPLLHYTTYANERILIFYNQQYHPTQLSQYTDKLFKYLNGNSFKLPITICYSAFEVTARELSQTVKKLRKLYHLNYQIWHPQCFSLLEAGDPLMLHKRVSAAKIDHIIQHFQNGRPDLFKKELHTMLAAWLESGISIDQYFHNLQYLLYSLRRVAPQANLAGWDNFCQEVYLSFTISTGFEAFANDFNELAENYLFAAGDDLNTRQTMETVKNYIDRHFNQPISIFDIANRFHISSSHLSRMFKSVYNQSPVQYLISLRIKEACDMMLHYPDLEFRYISELIGYTDQHYFSKLFKKYTGASPTEYRKKMDLTGHSKELI